MSAWIGGMGGVVVHFFMPCRVAGSPGSGVWVFFGWPFSLFNSAFCAVSDRVGAVLGLL